MTTRREHILDAVVAALAGTTNVGTKIYRSKVTALTRSTLPALLITWDTDTPTFNNISFTDWTLNIGVSVVVVGDIPDETADPIVESVFSKMFTDRTLGGYAIDIKASNHTNENVDSDKPTAIITLNFEILYRTSNTNLATL